MKDADKIDNRLGDIAGSLRKIADGNPGTLDGQAKILSKLEVMSITLNAVEKATRETHSILKARSVVKESLTTDEDERFAELEDRLDRRGLTVFGLEHELTKSKEKIAELEGKLATANRTITRLENELADERNCERVVVVENKGSPVWSDKSVRYVKGVTVVLEQGATKQYRAKITHISMPTNRPDTDGVNWEEMIGGLEAVRGKYPVMTAEDEKDLARYNDRLRHLPDGVDDPCMAFERGKNYRRGNTAYWEKVLYRITLDLDNATVPPPQTPVWERVDE